MRDDPDVLSFLEAQREMEISGRWQWLEMPTYHDRVYNPCTEAEAAEYERRAKEFAGIQEAAVDAWYDGGCCGHCRWRNEWTGYCEAASAPCYEHPLGVVLARERWERLEQEGIEEISPWARALGIQQLVKGMDDDANQCTDGEEGRRGSGVQQQNGLIQGETV